MTRPDGSLPPSPRTLHHDPYARCRRRSGVHPYLRARLDNRRHTLVQELGRLDAETAEWLQRRRALLNEAVDLHEQLWPAQPAGWVRRPPKPGARWMPPLPEPARRLSGWNLRTVCQALLRRFGALELPEMHALLHRYGYEIEARHPVKALADALGYEVLGGRAERVRRGLYRSLLEADGVPRDVDPLLAVARWRTGTFRRRVRDHRPAVAPIGGRIRTVRRSARRPSSHDGPRPTQHGPAGCDGVLGSVRPVTAATIEPSRTDDTDGLRALIVGIQHDEFGFDITWDDQPDLHEIDGFYRAGHGQFWVARDNAGTVIGSIGLRDCGDGLAALRKMFVAPAHRGRPAGAGGGAPVARRLLDTLLAHARETGFTTVLLGTTERFEAAHRFYEKHGFTLVDAATLPSAFPRMALDTRFYRLDLTA